MGSMQKTGVGQMIFKLYIATLITSILLAFAACAFEDITAEETTPQILIGIDNVGGITRHCVRNTPCLLEQLIDRIEYRNKLLNCQLRYAYSPYLQTECWEALQK